VDRHTDKEPNSLLRYYTAQYYIILHRLRSRGSSVSIVSDYGPTVKE
jgi:hypothetical protein